LDWDVPGKNGIEVLRWTRSNLPDHLPILMMTQHDGEEDIVFALDEGADDYLIKPISDRQLVARVNAQIRKTNSFFGRKNTTATHDEKITVGKYLLDVSARIVYINEENASHEKSIIHLPDREMQLAKLLFSNVGRIVNKDYLIRHIWECAPDRKYDPSLSTYISKLRKLLLLNIENDLIISTIYNYGYRLEYV
jgi:DNA-binding response OmpR family regulator